MKKSWKTSTAGLASIAAALALVGKLVQEKRWPGNEEMLLIISALATGFGLTVARDNDKSSEDVGAVTPATKTEEDPKPHSIGNPKTLVAALLIAGLFGITSGCSTTCGGTSPQDETNTLNRIRLVSELAASTGARLDLARNPEHRPAYEVANQTIAALILSEDYDPEKFRAALQNLPVDELRGDNAAIIVDAAVTLWNLTLLQSDQANTAPRVKAFAEGVHAGLTQALKTKPPN